MNFTKFVTAFILAFMIICSFSKAAFSQIQDSQAFQEAMKDIVPKRNANKYITKAEESVSEGNLREAISYYDKAIEAYPDNARTYIIRGQIKQELGNYEEAIKDYNRAVSVEPASQYNKNSLEYKFASIKDAEAYFYIGQVKITTENYFEAIHYFTLSIQKNSSSLAYFQRGNAKGMLGLVEEAIRDYTKATDLNQENKLIYLMRGLSQLELGKTLEACRDFNQAVDSEREKAARKLISEYCTSN